MSKYEHTVDQCCILATNLMEWRVLLPKGVTGVLYPFKHLVKRDTVLHISPSSLFKYTNSQTIKSNASSKNKHRIHLFKR